MNKRGEKCLVLDAFGVLEEKVSLVGPLREVGLVVLGRVGEVVLEHLLGVAQAVLVPDQQRHTTKPLKEVLDGVDKSFPLIMMDHQPFGLNEASDNQIDLQISGHTHNGQLWPLNFVISRIYELGWGYAVKGKTHYYVSCGVGGWGTPVRTGSRPEIIDIKIVFNGNQQAGPGK